MIIILYCVLVYFAYYNKKIMKNKFRLKIIKIKCINSLNNTNFMFFSCSFLTSLDLILKEWKHN